MEVAKQLRQGHALGGTPVDCGAMCMPGLAEKVAELVDEAVQKGAQVGMVHSLHVLCRDLLNARSSWMVLTVAEGAPRLKRQKSAQLHYIFTTQRGGASLSICKFLSCRPTSPEPVSTLRYRVMGRMQPMTYGKAPWVSCMSAA